MREFMMRQLRRAPIIKSFWDEYEQMLAARDAAFAERDAALEACDAAIAERDAAFAERDEMLGDRYVQTFFGREAALRDFRVPNRLAVSPIAAKRVLIIGSCFAEGIAHHAHRVIPDCQSDYILYNHASELPAEPPRPISEYDFQVILLPLRSVMPERAYMRLSYTDIAAHESFFDAALSRLHQLLDGALAYSRRFGKLTFIVNFLVPQQSPLGRLLPKADLRNPAYVCQRLNAEIEAIAASLRDVYVVDLDGIAAGIGKHWTQDDLICTFSHGTFLTDWDTHHDGNRLEPVVPITKQIPCLADELISAIWQEIAAMYRTLRQVDPIKMVVVDLDDTLWRGVAADAQSIDGFMVEGWPLGFVEALQYVRKRGVLVAVISKNESTLIEKLLPHLYGGALELTDFAAIKVNWHAKVENMEELLGEVNLLPRNVLFIDDNPVERAAMKAAFPDMRVVGGNPYEHRRLLLWAPEVQVGVITDESARRTEMIKAQVDREQSRRRLPRAEFLASLGLTLRLIVLTTPDHPQFRRAFELLNKTNQFNTTGKRWTMEEILRSLATGTVIHAFEVADIYTRYGLVGVIIRNGTTFEQFVMSCRVVGLDVELAAISILARQASGSQGGRVRAIVRDTDANLLSRDLWQRCGFERQEDYWTADPSGIVEIPSHIQIVAEPALAAVA
jgi:FkbH-like protein